MLKANDKVVIIAPAAQFRSADKALLDDALKLLESWSLNVDVLLEHGHHFYLAGPDKLRQKHLNQALMSSQYKAIFCTRGGYGAARLLNKLPTKEEVSSKFLIGHSDITTLHLAAAKHYPQINSIHGPNIATRQLLGSSEEALKNQSSLYEALFAPKTKTEYKVNFIKEGEGKGVIIGGCLSMICSLLGTPYLPDFKNKILLIEDVSEPPYKIDRMLQQLCNAGVIEQLKGVVFGDMYQCKDPYNDLTKVILDVLSHYNIPIAFGLETGHGPVNYSVPLGGHVVLDSNKKLLTLLLDEKRFDEK